jgi:Zn-dependent M28 family amino/carboxypeptidase
MAVLPGRSERRIYVSGHYDTVALRPPAEDSAEARTFDNFAPGANDGSGTALTMELTRAFKHNGYAAVRITESKENHDRQHTVRDTPVPVRR